MKIHIHHSDIHLLDLQTRMPFKYGIATMTRSPHAFVRVQAEVDGRSAVGVAADHLPPKWFTKDPVKALDVEVAEMLQVIDCAVAHAPGLRGDCPFDVWRQLWDRQGEWGRGVGFPPLLTQFGTSLIERAMIEAVCRARGQPFAKVLRANGFGIRLGDLHPELQGRQPGELLPERPLERITARHTIGLADPIEDADIAPAERLDDGLPQSLAACIRAYGLRHFKVKVSGSLDRDLDRLRRIAGVVEAHGPADFAFNLDGNEQFHSVDEFRSFWEALLNQPALKRFFEHLLFVEQPFHRSVALEPEALSGLHDWKDRPPLIIDESDAELDSVSRALQLGYAGSSYKNCKGVFKGVANACLLAHLRRQHPERPFLMSGEDMCSIGPVSMIQDLAACAAIGVESVERNGHHYFAGLSMFPTEVQRQVLEAHGDLYHPSRDGWPTLNIRNGTVSVGSLNAAPFGIGFALNVEQFPRWPQEAKQP